MKKSPQRSLAILVITGLLSDPSFAIHVSGITETVTLRTSLITDEALAVPSHQFPKSSIAEQRLESAVQSALTSAVLRRDESLVDRFFKGIVTQSSKLKAKRLLEQNYPFYGLKPNEVRHERHRHYRILTSPSAPTIHESLPEHFRNGDPIIVISPGRIHLEFLHHLFVEMKHEKGRPRDDYYWMPGGLAYALESPRVGVVVISDSMPYLDELKLPLRSHALRFGTAIDRLRARYPASRLTYIGSSLGARIQIEELAINRRKATEVAGVISLNAAMRLGSAFMRVALGEAWTFERIYGVEARNFMASLVTGAAPDLADRLQYDNAPELLFIGVDAPKRFGGHQGSDGIVDLQGALGRGFTSQEAISVHLQGLTHGNTSTHPKVHALLQQIVPIYARGESLRRYQVQVNATHRGSWGDYSPVKPLAVLLSDSLEVSGPAPHWDITAAILKKWGLGIAHGAKASYQFARKKWGETRQASTRTAMTPLFIGVLATSIYSDLATLAGASLMMGGVVQWIRHVWWKVPEATERPANLKPFSAADRAKRIVALDQHHVEVLVVGVGGPGSSIAAHLANRGIKTALIGRGDFAEEASGNNSSMAHAYIKYLAQGRVMYLIQEACERLRLEKIAPHWIRPFPILLATERNGAYSLSLLRLVTWSYAWIYRIAGVITGMPAGTSPRTYNQAELQERIPGLAEDVIGATEYDFDGGMDSARLTFGFAQYAHARGAAVISHATLQEWIIEKGRLNGAVFRDDISSLLFSVRADLVVNATGASIDRVREKAGLHTPLMRPTLGVHLIIEQLTPFMVIFPLAWGGRMFLNIPVGHRLSKVGPTDTSSHFTPEETRPQEADIIELVRLIFRYFPGKRTIGVSEKEAIQRYLLSAVKRVEWGLRPLYGLSGSRRHRIVREMQGRLYSIVGVKMTAIRKVGDDVSRDIFSALGYGHADPLPLFLLPGGNVDESFNPRTENDYFKRTYGALAREVYDLVRQQPELGERVLPDKPWIWAQVVYSARYEGVMTLNDFLWQRTDWARISNLPEHVVAQVAHLLANELRWSPAEVIRQIKAFNLKLHSHLPMEIAMPVFRDTPAPAPLRRAA